VSKEWLSEDELSALLQSEEQAESEKEDDIEEEPRKYEVPDLVIKKIVLEEFSADNKQNWLENATFNTLLDVPLDIRVVLGRTEKTIEEILEVEPGSVIPLKKLAGEPVEIMVSGQLMAKGEIVILDDRFAVSITEIVSPKERLAAFHKSTKKNLS
jgi:flagellar motor switch protein FliN/FliY